MLRLRLSHHLDIEPHAVPECHGGGTFGFRLKHLCAGRSSCPRSLCLARCDEFGHGVVEGWQRGIVAVVTTVIVGANVGVELDLRSGHRNSKRCAHVPRRHKDGLTLNPSTSKPLRLFCWLDFMCPGGGESTASSSPRSSDALRVALCCCVAFIRWRGVSSARKHQSGVF